MPSLPERKESPIMGIAGLGGGVGSNLVAGGAGTGGAAMFTWSGSTSDDTYSWVCPDGVSQVRAVVIGGGGGGGQWCGGGGGEPKRNCGVELLWLLLCVSRNGCGERWGVGALGV